MTTPRKIKQPIVIGIVGGIASGKSEVTRILGSMNAVIISADEIGHRVLQESDVIDSLLVVFGECILQDPVASSSGLKRIDRKKLGAIVFGDAPENQVLRKKLEAIVHPRIRQLARTELETLVQESAHEMIVLDAPLLIEGGWLPYCDRVLFVDSPDAMRKQRATQRGWLVKEWQDRESAQLPLAEKKSFASDLLVNDGDRKQLTQRVMDFVMGL